ncbi:MAG: hypothetical protein ACOH17_09370 [Cellulomonas sp.]
MSAATRSRHSWLLLGVGVAAAAGALLLGVDLVHALVIGIGIAVVIVVAWTVDMSPDPGWTRAPVPGRDGARGELSTLSWTMVGRDGRVGERALRRVRAVGASRLARLGLDVADPADADAIHALVGARAWKVLTITGGRNPSIADVEHAVARLERLDPARPAPETAAHRLPRRTT